MEWAFGTACNCKYLAIVVGGSILRLQEPRLPCISMAASGTGARSTALVRRRIANGGTGNSQGSKREMLTPTSWPENDGWSVVRVWEHDDPIEAARQIAATVQVRTRPRQARTDDA